MMEPTDIELMVQAREGDNQAFEVLVMRHQKGLINYFYRLSWNRALAEDQAQETFLRVYQNRQRYRPTSKFTTYLYRIAKNLWIDHIRQLGRRGKPMSLEAAECDDASLRDLLPARDRGASQARETAEKMKQVMQAVDQLNESQRELFTLAQINRLKYQEIGEILGIPEGTVKTRMHSLMKKLRKFLVKSS